MFDGDVGKRMGAGCEWVDDVGTLKRMGIILQFCLIFLAYNKTQLLIASFICSGEIMNPAVYG